MIQKVKRLLKIVSLILIVGSAILIGLFALSYLKPDFTKNFLQGKETYFYGIYQIGFYAHIFAASLSLLTASILVYFRLEIRNKVLHRNLGKLYLILVLFLAAPGGFLISFYSIGGWISGLSFQLLAILWFYFSIKAYLEIRKRNYLQHQQYMMRSFMLALSAVLLRLYGVIAMSFTISSPEVRYLWISWLCWVPNLLVYELYLYFKIKKF